MPNNRRDFIKNAALLPAALAGSSALTRPSKMSDHLPDQLTVVFQGDSITDAGRDRERTEPNDYGKMGVGYSLLVAAMLLGEHPETDLTYYNRGISGNKVYQLDERWEADALSLQPDVVSILIGVNDFWHMLNGNYDGTVDVYRKDFAALLNRTREALPEVKFIIGEPFIIRGGSAVGDDRWKNEFPTYQSAARAVAAEFDAAWIPYQRVFDEALEEAPAAHWSHDGVHPSLAGSYVMARAWMEAFEGLY
ncbi:SGNH/GDSL hydrolase family protein [Neolewinella litorea]|uniref:Twin-arginine translocation signal domain-containing protein n=1 Tax=Neolewinella litorea TaxID=2562452 RepID=A0A4S4NAH4_9BACT|nr:SGNH/GDSL hydrolase family protein [Neolewinella litorea]THH36324.1 twin-arginine translocation signal domain-containing protein [Neolewinella litorea]